MGWQQFIAVAGVAVLVLLAWRLGALKTARLVDGKAAEDRFAQDFPYLKPSHSFVSADGELALLTLEDGHVGAVFAVGDKFATRLWRGGELTSIESEGDRLVITTGDVTRRTLTTRGLSEADRSILRTRLSALCEAKA